MPGEAEHLQGIIELLSEVVDDEQVLQLDIKKGEADYYGGRSYEVNIIFFRPGPRTPGAD